MSEQKEKYWPEPLIKNCGTMGFPISKWAENNGLSLELISSGEDENGPYLEYKAIQSEQKE